MISFYQVLAVLIKSIKVKYPVWVLDMLRILSVLQLDLSSVVLTSRCALEGVNFYHGLLVSTLMPPFALGLLALWAYLNRDRKKTTWSDGPENVSWSGLVFIVFLPCSFFIYPSITTKIFSTFNCDEMECEVEPCPRYLTDDYSISCDADDRNYWIAYAWFCIFVYPIGIPAFYAYLLFRGGGRDCITHAIEMKRAGVPEGEKEDKMKRLSLKPLEAAATGEFVRKISSKVSEAAHAVDETCGQRLTKKFLCCRRLTKKPASKAEREEQRQENIKAKYNSLSYLGFLARCVTSENLFGFGIVA